MGYPSLQILEAVLQCPQLASAISCLSVYDVSKFDQTLKKSEKTYEKSTLDSRSWWWTRVHEQKTMREWKANDGNQRDPSLRSGQLWLPHASAVLPMPLWTASGWVSEAVAVVLQDGGIKPSSGLAIRDSSQWSSLWSKYVKLILKINCQTSYTWHVKQSTTPGSFGRQFLMFL